MRYGGDSGERQQSIAGHHKFMDDARQSNKTFDATERWIDYRGEWIDWVLRVAWYDHDNPSAVFHLYMNGKLVYGKERDGLRNIATDRKPQWYPLQCYMPAYSTDYECVDSPSGGSNKIKNYNQPHTRATFMDEFRFGDSLSGIKDYCGVAPPIWPLPPKIDSLLKDAIGVKTSPTILYGKPENHREDRHNCFRRVATQVQVSLVGDDWSSLAYDSNNSGETAQQIIGLSENTKYQLRVRHKNKRSGSDEIYNGEWSETIFFTTGKADFGNAAKKIEQVKNFEAIFR